MAVFGSPVARGDDAERAVRAALAIPGIIEQLNETSPHPDLEIHLAVNTGEAVVTIEPGSPDGDLLVAGDVVNTASRLQGAAPPGRVLIGEETFRATRRVIRSEPVPAVAAKGKREPIPAWMAIEALVPLSVRPDLGTVATALHITPAAALILARVQEQPVTIIRRTNFHSPQLFRGQQIRR